MSPVPAEEPKEWIRRSEYDIETAEAMLKARRYLYVVFCSQQAIEKRLKAIIVEKSGQMPPRIHDLVRLADGAAVSNSEDQTHLLKKLNYYYVESRYPEEQIIVAEQTDKEFAQGILEQTKEYIAWLVQ